MIKILFLEDEPTILEVTTEYMKMKDYEVFCATDAEEAMKLIKNDKFDIAILDIMVPKVSGLDILEYINKKDLVKINIKQGYSKCSICIVDENSIITSDKGIYKSVKEYGIDCLLISSGNINLLELDSGFIGGCTGFISKNKIGFFGDIKKHPDYESIKKFIKSKNKEIVILSKENLLDLGSIIPLMTRKE